MPARKKLAVVLSVLVTGGSTALFFRKDASQTDIRQEAPSNNPFRQHVERRVATDSAWARQPAPPSTASGPRQTFRVPPAATAAIAEPQGLAPESQPSFRTNFNPVGALLEPLEGVTTDEDDADRPDDFDRPPERLDPRDEAPREHRIVDGDTLSKLAAHYLGRADRYTEIFDLNRKVLANPDLLPIGTWIKIPPRQETFPATGPQETEKPPPPAELDPPLGAIPAPSGGTWETR